MSTKPQVVYVVTHETKLDGKWTPSGRVFSLWEDAQKEIENLTWFAEKSKPAIVRRVSKPQVMMAYL